MRNYIRFTRITSLLLILALLLAMPAPAFADGGDEPEPTPAGSEATSAETTEETPVDEAEATEAATDAITETATEEPVSTETEAAAEAAATATTTCEASAGAPEGAADTCAATVAVESEETVADVVNVISDTDSVLLGADGEVLSMASNEAEDLLGAPDPWFENPGDPTQVIAYQADCTGWAPPSGYAGGVCNVSATPIQSAVDAAPVGGTVHVEAGTFTEQVEINKDLRLQGSSGAIIKSPTNLTDSFTTSNVNYPIIYVHDADDVVIDGFTVDGDNQGNSNYRFVGIGYYNAGGTISNNTVTGITNTPFNGSQHGNAIMVFNDDGVERVIVIDSNIVEDYQKTGILVAGDDLTAEITDNTVTGAGPTGVIAQNGIQVGTGDVDATISGNTVTGNYYSGATWTSSGVLIFSEGDVEMSDNVILENQTGVYIQDANVTMDGDEIADSQYSIIVYGVTAGASADLTNTTITNSEIGVYVYGTSDGNSTVTVQNSEISEHDYGVYTNQSNTIINNNSLWNNTYGVYSDAPGQVDATGNYWGCWQGPGNPDCDEIVGDVLSNPYLTVRQGQVDSDLDGILNGADNCPTTFNPEQDRTDLDGDGIPDTCDSYVAPDDDGSQGTGTTGTGTSGTGGAIIPVTGAGVNTYTTEMTEDELNQSLADNANLEFPLTADDESGAYSLACVMESITFLDEASYIENGDQLITVIGTCSYLANGVKQSVTIILAMINTLDGTVWTPGQTEALNLSDMSGSFEDLIYGDMGLEPGSVLTSTFGTSNESNQASSFGSQNHGELINGQYTEEQLANFALTGDPSNLNGFFLPFDVTFGD